MRKHVKHIGRQFVFCSSSNQGEESVHLASEASAIGFAWMVIYWWVKINAKSRITKVATDMCQLYLGEGSVFIIYRDTFHCVQSGVCAIDDFSKNRILCVKVRLLRIGNEKLGFVRIWT